MLAELLGAIVDGLIGGAITDRLMRRRTDRDAKKSYFRCGLRVTSGAYPGLSDRWRVAQAHVTPGRITMEGRQFRIAALGNAMTRSPRFRELWTLPADSVILRAKTATAELELALGERYLPQVREALGARSG